MRIEVKYKGSLVLTLNVYSSLDVLNVPEDVQKEIAQKLLNFLKELTEVKDIEVQILPLGRNSE